MADYREAFGAYLPKAHAYHYTTYYSDGYYAERAGMDEDGITDDVGNFYLKYPWESLPMPVPKNANVIAAETWDLQTGFPDKKYEVEIEPPDPLIVERRIVRNYVWPVAYMHSLANTEINAHMIMQLTWRATRRWKEKGAAYYKSLQVVSFEEERHPQVARPRQIETIWEDRYYHPDGTDDHPTFSEKYRGIFLGHNCALYQVEFDENMHLWRIILDPHVPAPNVNIPRELSPRENPPYRPEQYR